MCATNDLCSYCAQQVIQKTHLLSLRSSLITALKYQRHLLFSGGGFSRLMLPWVYPMKQCTQEEQLIYGHGIH